MVADSTENEDFVVNWASHINRMGIAPLEVATMRPYGFLGFASGTRYKYKGHGCMYVYIYIHDISIYTWYICIYMIYIYMYIHDIYINIYM